MKKENTLKPKGIYLKMGWDELFRDLDDASVGRLIKNSYNHVNQRELIEMDKMELLLFKHTIATVLDFNLEKYNLKVEHNRSIAHKGGRPRKKTENPLGFSETQIIPEGFFKNPEIPKDKDIDIDKGIDKGIDKENDKVKNKANNKAQIEKMKKLIEKNLKELSNDKDINFSVMVKELVRLLGWARFELLVFHTSDVDVEPLLLEYDKPGCLQGIKDIRKLYPDYLEKIIKD